RSLNQLRTRFHPAENEPQPPRNARYRLALNWILKVGPAHTSPAPAFTLVLVLAPTLAYVRLAFRYVRLGSRCVRPLHAAPIPKGSCPRNWEELMISLEIFLIWSLALQVALPSSMWLLPCQKMKMRWP